LKGSIGNTGKKYNGEARLRRALGIIIKQKKRGRE